jgi:DNA-binding MarR family transcriptional regulator
MYHGSSMKLQSLPCYCATLRQAARAVTALYEEALSDGGIRSTQFTILQALEIAPNLQTTEVAQLLGIDQTTATRTLALMRKNKLAAHSIGADRRERRWRLTRLGDAAYRRLLPKWESAQAIVERRLGRAEAANLKKMSFRAALEFSTADENLRK